MNGAATASMIQEMAKALQTKVLREMEPRLAKLQRDAERMRADIQMIHKRLDAEERQRLQRSAT